jgi:hypothetical protein
MFDLLELDQAETALRQLASGVKPVPARAPKAALAEHPKGDVSRCPFHNGTLARAEMAAA